VITTTVTPATPKARSRFWHHIRRPPQCGKQLSRSSWTSNWRGRIQNGRSARLRHPVLHRPAASK